MDIKREKKHFLIRIKYYIIGGTLLLALIIYVIVISLEPNKLRQDINSLQISEVKKEKFREYLDLEGVAQPKLTIKLNSNESGIVERITADDGAVLKKGDTILILRNSDLMRDIEDERDNLEKQKILYREKLLQMRQNTSELKRNIMKTTYDLKKLSKQHELDKEEYSIGIRSKAQLDVSVDEYEYNKTNAQLLLQELKEDSIKNIIQQDLLSKDMEREEKKYIRQRDKLDNLIITAPIDGQLSFLSVIPGEKVDAGHNIGELKEINSLKITASIGEYYIERIAVGLPASITYKGKRYPLVVSKINPEIKERSFSIDLLFTEDIPDNIRIGKTCRIQIEMGQAENALVINKGNFYQSTGGKWLFKLTSNRKAIKTDIIIGRQNPMQYEILEGLKSGDKVIISGYENFDDIQELIIE